jgi:RNA polymerase sigma factor (sigma-70 family)
MPGGTTTLLQQQINRLNAGENGARDELIERACNRMQRLARRILQDYPAVRRFADSGDLAQNTVLRLMRSLQARLPGSVADFFRLAALEMRHGLIDLTRHYFGPLGAGVKENAPVSSAFPGQVSEPDSAGTFNPETLAYWTEFHEAVERLPGESRIIFDLLWYHEMTNEEAADALGCSIATVKRRWLEARLQLQELVPRLLGPDQKVPHADQSPDH